MPESEKPNEGELILYHSQEGTVRIEVLLPGLLGYLGDKIASRVQRDGALLLDGKR